MSREPRWDCEESPDLGASWLDVLMISLAFDRWPLILAWVAGFAVGHLAFWWLT